MKDDVQQYLPLHQRTNSLNLRHAASRLSTAPTLSPTEASYGMTIEHEASIKDPTRKRPSLFKRRFRSEKQHAAHENEIRGPLGLRSLFSSPEPLIDLVFVHGLRGGSIKTFCKDQDPNLFWPQRWLPLEPEFSSASIHSFGYDSDWGNSRPSNLTVHDFGRSLYEELQTSPLLRHNSKNRPIVLIGHSMGGLVIKKAYILAQQDRLLNNLSDRIKCMFFLATPHRGSDYASFLDGVLTILSVTNLTSSKEYLKDLNLDSTSTQLINEDFTRLAGTTNLTIYTFYELWSTIPGASGLIVKKNSAVLGLPINEHVQYLDANHRDICKFAGMDDPNYIRVKNALGTAVESLLENACISDEKSRTVQLQTLKEALGFPAVPDEQHDKLEGSCYWIEEREDFQRWLDPESDWAKSNCYAEVLWIQAQPGAGKTVLAAHVATRLAENRLPFSSYFFQFGKKTNQSLSGFLQSIAFQMATTNAAVRQKLAQLCEDGTPLHYDNAHTTWTKIFVGGIFQVPIVMPQFWIVDGLDECINSHEFSKMLNGTRLQFPLRIFLTSRKLPNMQKIIDQLTRCKVTVTHIPLSDTMRDIELYISKRIRDLPIDDEEEQTELSGKILAKCSACFLWVRLVMDELEGVYGYESISQVLEEIPEGMMSYYKRAVLEMAAKRETPIAKAILRWTVLAARPLTVSELSNAIEQDLGTHFSSAKSAIEGLCGQLVTIEPNTEVVQTVHATAREFLMSDEAGDFRISRSIGHATAAITCLKLLLASTSMRAPRSRSIAEKRPTPPSSALLNYATVYFSDHIFSSSVSNTQLLKEICQFLTRNVLRWIEIVVAQQGLQILIKTAKNLKGYLDRLAKHESPLNSYVQTVDGWATDLSRITSKFGRALTSSPHSIFFLIPPLCPTQSTIYKQFLKTRIPDGLSISGSQYAEWDDCIAQIHFEDETATAISCGNNLIAVGTESGNINLYSSQTYQKEKVLLHGAPIDLLKFDPLGSFLVASSRKLVTVWELDGTLRWKTRIRSRCILLSSSQYVLIGITQQGRSYQWDLTTGALVNEQSYVYQSPDTETTPHPNMAKAPSTASLSPELDLLALAYRNSPVCIFEFSTGTFISWIIDESSRAAEMIVFNPNPDVSLLVVAYNESHLALYEPWSGALVESLEAERPAILSSISCACDGRTFATVDILGHLRIWDFESLVLLYHVLTPTTSFSLLEFTSDTTNLVNLTDHEMRIWAPTSLIRKNVEEEASISEQAASLTTTEGQFEQLQASKTKTFVAHAKLPLLFTGNNHGDVFTYMNHNRYQPSILYTHGQPIRCIAVSSNNLVATGDTNAGLQVWHVQILPQQAVKTVAIVFKISFSSPISQLLFDNSGDYLLVSTLYSDHVYRTTDGSLVGTQKTGGSRTIWKWASAQSSAFEGQFLLVQDHKFVSYSIVQFPTQVYSERFPLDYTIDEGSSETGIEAFTFHPETSIFILEIRQQRGFTPYSTTFNFQLAISPSPTLTPLPSLPPNIIKRFLGFNQTSKRLIFLHQESWICSVDPKDLSKTLQRYTQHFLVPDEYVPTNSEVSPVQTADGDFAFCLFDKVIVVRNGLKFQTVKEVK